MKSIKDDDEEVLLLLAAMDMDAGTIKATVQFEAPKPELNGRGRVGSVEIAD